MTIVTLTHADIGTDVKVLCNNVLVSGNKNNDSKPDIASDTLTEVQTQSFENPKYVLSNINITGDSGSLTYTHILNLYKLRYIGTNPVVLKIQYGAGTTVPSLTESTSGINVVLDSFSVNFDTKETKNAYIPTATLTFKETK